ncbi:MULTISPECIES: helix-turn-helix domain-containing protein [unclassified Janthinobacterium]|uniref:helix-turn-helix domain-containing protein n=1 Tax=unclassified Janthinobacterium TaxID=2610881 RepID=UPI002474AEA9|nr:helix-turn-helix domain-containing protein [Janthinobacterium sp. CG_23.4]MDH6158874.1 AraC-like DNA-binding protein [Janthinobacterium sp. CG_23.4]
MDKADSAANLLDVRAQAPKGIVDPQAAARRIRLATYPPPAALAPFVEYCWVVEWDRRGCAPETQRVLPYPNAHLVFDAGHSAIHGVVRGAFDRPLIGAGKVLGVRFAPGGLRPFITQPLSSFTDTTIAADALLGMPAAQAEARVLGKSDDLEMVAQAQELLLARLPQVDAAALLAARLTAAAAAHNGPASVAQLCEKMAIGERRLQRLFADYVGVPPKWVIQRYRLQEAIWRLAQPDAPDLASLAHALGFFDQAHFSRSFAQLVGSTPLDYRRSQLPKPA